MKIFRSLGESVNIFLQKVGGITKFIISIFSNLITLPIYGGEIVKAFFQIGWMSLPVLGLTALFTGGALALQIYAGGSRFNAEQVVPAIVAIGMARELGPVLGGLIVAARVASSIAAEIGTMKVTEQLDALTTLSTNPIKYLVVPRIIAATLSLPALIAVGDSIGILGGYLVGVNRLDFSSSTYLASTASMLQFSDIYSGIVKGVFFWLYYLHIWLL
jgi:phospholipid/cholesterol/gamma-HCH transport system permease protein